MSFGSSIEERRSAREKRYGAADKTEESGGNSELLRKWPTDLTATRLSTTMAIYFTQETQSSLARGNREKIRVRRELYLVRLAENRVEFPRQA